MCLATKAFNANSLSRIEHKQLKRDNINVKKLYKNISL